MRTEVAYSEILQAGIKQEIQKTRILLPLEVCAGVLSMQSEPRVFGDHEPNQDILNSAFFIEQVCLAVPIQIVLINLISHFFVRNDHSLPAGLLHMQAWSAYAGLSATAALFLSKGNRSMPIRRIGQILAAGTAAIAAFALWMGAPPLENLLRGDQLTGGWSSLLASAGFLLSGIVIFLIRTHDSFWSYVADTLACCLAFLVLILFSEFLFGLAQIPGSSTGDPVKGPMIACLAFLTLAVILFRAEHGVFKVFLSSGIDGRVVRILAPILLSLPFLRELGRARLLDAHLIPPRYATALLTSTATMVGFALLLMLSRILSRMQTEIQQLNLRDDLTGLYNFRGFNLLAEQAYRLARRSREPFGVLFADMDNLKAINDELGHNAGSVCIVETAKMLSAIFRETDVVGRLGGDEFVVAGQFDRNAIATAIERLRSAAGTERKIGEKTFSLSLSLGYALSEHAFDESLKTVIARADKAMYQEKRAKKRAAAG